MTETEIVLPFSVEHLHPPGNALQFYTAGLTSLGLGILLFVFHIELLLAIVLIAAGVLLLISPVLIAWSSKTVSRQVVCINHEGVLFAPRLPNVVKWGDISTVTLSTWTSLGHPSRVVSFVPRDPEAMTARLLEHGAKNGFSRLLMKTNMVIYRRTHAPSPLMISQQVSPIPLEELLAMIQERFARELRENRVAVLGWQESEITDRRA